MGKITEIRSYLEERRGEQIDANKMFDFFFKRHEKALEARRERNAESAQSLEGTTIKKGDRDFYLVKFLGKHKKIWQ